MHESCWSARTSNCAQVVKCCVSISAVGLTVSVCVVSREALHHDEGHSKARLSLAELQLLKGELEDASTSV